MTVQEARRTADARDAAARLLALDELWTRGFENLVADEDRLAVIAIGSEMRSILERLRDQSPSLSGLVLRDPTGFEAVAADVLQKAPLAEDVKRSIREETSQLGWAGEAAVAFEYIGSSEEIDRELERQILSLIAGATSEDGDLPGWFRCTLSFLVAALGIGTAVLSGGAPAALGMAVLAPVMQLGLDLNGCAGVLRRSPSHAKEIEEFGQLLDRGRITDDQYHAKVRQLLRLDPLDPAEGISMTLTRDLLPLRQLDLSKPRKRRVRKKKT